jgi:GH43 family beta-xylosidase
MVFWTGKIHIILTGNYAFWSDQSEEKKSDDERGEICMKFRRKAEDCLAEQFRLKAELHTYFACFVIPLLILEFSTANNYFWQLNKSINYQSKEQYNICRQDCSDG